MATVYYPTGSTLYWRTVANAQLIEQTINVAPDSVFVLSGSNVFTTSLVPTLMFTSSHYEITASQSDNTTSASIALSGSGGITGTYNIVAGVTMSFVNGFLINVSS